MCPRGIHSLTYLIFFILFTFGTAQLTYYKGYKGNTVTITLDGDGYCQDESICKELSKYTTLYGNLILRHGHRQSHIIINGTKPYFPKLREITGYLVIGLYNMDHFDILPSLSVIRGHELLFNYAFIIYFNDELKEVNFSNLTVILLGGVRVASNKKLCYVGGIRWKSIVRDTYQSEKFGLVVENNNPNCDSGCATDKCKVVPGHGSDSNAQHCWGPGTNETNQCQKFCHTKCKGGCLEGTIDNCCHKECLGGCYKVNSSLACIACKHYRVEHTGECVRRCPRNLFLVNGLTCEAKCPGFAQSGQQQYSLNGSCVADCPAGYQIEAKKLRCRQCLYPDGCPKICTIDSERVDGVLYQGAIIHLPSDIVKRGVAGCTEIQGSLTINLREGTGFMNKYIKDLATIKKIKGHLKIYKTSLEKVDLFPNLLKVDPQEYQLLFKKYAIAIYDNNNLTSLWAPNRKIIVSRGKLFAKSNPKLCPRVIRKFKNRLIYDNGSVIEAKIAKHTNGHLTSCDMNQLQLKVEEISKMNLDVMQHSLICFLRKCVSVEWRFELNANYRNIIFFTIYYRRLKEDEELTINIGNDYLDTEGWESIEKKKPKYINVEKYKDKNGNEMGKLSTIISDVVPHGKYAFFLKEEATGKNRYSKIHIIRISHGIPSPPLGLEASFLSNSSIILKWRMPNEPNGEIVRYNLYWQKASYSYWREKQSLDWCKRTVKLGTPTKKLAYSNTSLMRGTCDVNFTCICSTDKEKAKTVKADREAWSFRNQFAERFNELVFTKPKTAQKNKKSSFKGLSKNQNRKKRWSTPALPGRITLPHRNINPDVSPDAFVSGTKYTYTIQNLDYFQDYIFTVCACTKEEKNTSIGGCAKPKKGLDATCATTQARTDSSDTADDLDGDITVNVLDKKYNISWNPPKSPNAIVLRYEIQVSTDQGNSNNDYTALKICHAANEPTNRIIPAQSYGVYYFAKVRAISPAGNGSWSKPNRFYIRDTEKEESQIVVVGVSVGCAVIVVFMFAIVLYYALFQRNIERGVPGVLYASVNPEYLNSSEVYIPDEWELNREKIELLQEIGQGSFGMVYEGIAHDIGGQLECRVAVKTVNENASIRDRIQFLQEASIMKAFKSNHVTRLIGVVSQGQPTFVVMELMMSGDLQSFLRKRRPEDHPKISPLTSLDTIKMAAQIADGMAYLSARKYVHRDLAARNCFVASDRTVKIGDFGLARDIYETDYYRKGGKGLLPVRWMAPESLKDGIFTTSSDVWSFGVVIWEIVTYALQPYQGKSNEELLQFVGKGGLLRYPEDCDPIMQNLMNLSWQHDPKLRPSFLEIVRMLEDFVPEDFVNISFYHEMKRQALEDTMCQEGNLHELLGRPNSSKSKKRNKNGSKQGCGSVSSVDSGAYIENCKPEADQTPELGTRKSLLSDDDDRDIVYTPNDPLLSQDDHEDSSIYGDSDVNMTYGDTPVYDNNHNSSSDEGSGDLKISKIFFGKPVPV